ncbi:MAG: cyanophycinase [Mangrovicoccus sp.]|nr:cyanophycinase [Mangrovicoccus sp.]
MAVLPSRVARAANGGRKLVIIGGRLEDDNTALYAEMHRLSGGKILVFPTASSEPEAVGEETRAAFADHGFEVAVAAVYGPNAVARAHDPHILAQIAEYGSVFFTGGDQSEIFAALAPGGQDTPALQAIRAMHDAGGLLAGSSAGAAMMSQPMILGGTSLEAVVHGVTEDPEQPGMLMGEGLGFFAFGIVDQHFIKRGRLARMVVALEHSGLPFGLGVDENTGLVVEGAAARVCGEYGVILVHAPEIRTYSGTEGTPTSQREFKLSYLDHGDSIDLRNLRLMAGAEKRKTTKADMAYRAPIRSRRNAFGAYALYDLLARLVLGDSRVYRSDKLEAYDARSGTKVELQLSRIGRSSRGLIATPESGLRMSAYNFSCRLVTEHLPATQSKDRVGRQIRTFGMRPRDDARIMLLGSSPLRAGPELSAALQAVAGTGPVGIVAAASAEPREVALDHIALFRDLGIEAVDLGVTIDTVDYANHDDHLLESIFDLSAVFLCGGNQIRLVETLLHRGEESALLRALGNAHANGMPLIAASGAASALSGVMIAGGSTYEALRFGVASDVGHQGLAIQEGVGLFGGGIVDQNLINSRRLGRLIVACAEESERFGLGIFEDSAVTATFAGTQLMAGGRQGCVVLEIDPMLVNLHVDRFVANGIRLTALGPGDQFNLKNSAVARHGDTAVPAQILQSLMLDMAREAGQEEPGETPGVHGSRVVIRENHGASMLIDLECPRE